MKLYRKNQLLRKRKKTNNNLRFKVALSGLRQFLATKSLLQMIKNAFYFTSKALFILKIFKSLSCFFGKVVKQLNMKEKINSKILIFNLISN